MIRATNALWSTASSTSSALAVALFAKAVAMAAPCMLLAAVDLEVQVPRENFHVENSLI